MTVLLCCSMAGERLKPLVISRHPCPASLHGVPVEDLPVVWCHHPRPVITADIFAGWLRSLEASMEQQGRHVSVYFQAKGILNSSQNFKEFYTCSKTIGWVRGLADACCISSVD